MISIWSWIADAVLAVMMTATLAMAIRLDRALRVVRRDRAVFETLISNLGSATNSVKLGIQALRNEADRAAEQIERRSEDADKLATDLSFLIEAADRAGARLEEARQAVQPSEQPTVAQRSEPQETPLAPAGETFADDASGGLRQLTGIARRRRVRMPVSELAAVLALDAEEGVVPLALRGVR